MELMEKKIFLSIKKNENFLKKSFLLGFALSIAAIMAGSITNTAFLYIICFSLGSFPAAGIFLYFFMLYRLESQKMSKEALVPDLLLQASAFPKGIAITKIFVFFSKADFGLLGKEFEIALLEIEKGVSVEEALENIKKRCKSRIIGRAIDLLIRGYESGADMGSVFRAAADDFFETNSILRERNSALVIEKYTLLFAGGLIVPAILGLLFGMVSGIDFSGLQNLEIGAGSAERSAILEATAIASQIYIAEYALLASFFIASQEGNSKKAFLYALFLLPISFAINLLAKTIIF
ncbi:MAG: type II secretion system F family protein [Candidatus ainarchaeum sp.]|nr:type II secretion system F family protein [Candidatus ainarchaeum sp.]